MEDNKDVDFNGGSEGGEQRNAKVSWNLDFG